MSKKKVGSLKKVPLHDVWKHEAKDFTPWLEKNIDVLNNVLNDVTDLSLSVVESEHPAGAFSIDLVAQDESGNPVIIENQLKQSNHDHLGKLITYLTQIDAKAAIWIVSDPRPEHIKAITWLNESSSAAFYLLKIEAVQIGNSPPAPVLTLIVNPSEEIQKVGKTKKKLKKQHILRYRFWTQLLERAKDKTTLPAYISPIHFSYLPISTGIQGLKFRYAIKKRTSEIDLYIDRGKEAGSENEKIFDTLKQSQAEIEEAFGEPLDWQRPEGNHVRLIGKQFSLGGYRDDEEKWPEIQDAMIDGMIRFEQALKPHIDKLPT